MKLMVKAVIAVVAVVGTVAGLAVTCPDEDSFRHWAKEEMTPESASVVEQAKGMALTAQAKWTADYENHLLWATVDAYQGSARQRFVGVMGTWFEIGGE
jgi:hypothetical protein